MGCSHPEHDNLNSTPYTLHFTPYTQHPSPYTLHPTLYTLPPTPYSLKPALYTLNIKSSTLQPQEANGEDEATVARRGVLVTFGHNDRGQCGHG